MNHREVSEQLAAGARCIAAEAPSRVPAMPGYYSIFVDHPLALPNPYGDLLAQRGTRLIYMGIATVSLHERLVEQDLLHRRASTFFRGVGTILGYRPRPGSLVGIANQNNYRFSAPDTAAIIAWINEHLAVNWVEADPALAAMEASLIREHRPLVNKTHNPDPVAELADLRRECRRIARTPVSR